jgi:hypothetical protein
LGRVVERLVDWESIGSDGGRSNALSPPDARLDVEGAGAAAGPCLRDA